MVTFAEKAEAKAKYAMEKASRAMRKSAQAHAAATSARNRADDAYEQLVALLQDDFVSACDC